MWWDGMGWHMGPVGWGWMLFGGLWMLLFWGGLIWLVVWAINRLSRGPEAGRGGERPTPLEVARLRYARGEISREEFEQLKRDLTS